MIDVAVIVNALRVAPRTPPPLAYPSGRNRPPAPARSRDTRPQLRQIARHGRMLDDVTPEAAAKLIEESNTIVQQQVVTHERDDEGKVYPALARILTGDRYCRLKPSKTLESGHF